MKKKNYDNYEKVSSFTRDCMFQSAEEMRNCTKNLGRALEGSVQFPPFLETVSNEQQGSLITLRGNNLLEIRMNKKSITKISKLFYTKKGHLTHVSVDQTLLKVFLGKII